VLLSFITVTGKDLKVWNALTGMLERHYKHLDGTITCAALDERYTTLSFVLLYNRLPSFRVCSNRRIIIGLHNGRIKVLSYSSGAYMKELDPHDNEVSAVKFVSNMPDGYKACGKQLSSLS